MTGENDAYLESRDGSKSRRPRILSRRVSLVAVAVVAVMLGSGTFVSPVAAEVTAQDANKAISAFHVATTSEAELRGAMETLMAFLQRPDVPAGNRAGIQQYLDAGMGTLDKNTMMNALYGYYDGLSAQSKQLGRPLNWGNQADLDYVRRNGWLNYRKQIPGTQLSGLDNVYWQTMSKYELEAIRNYAARQNGQPVPAAALPNPPGAPQPAPQPAATPAAPAVPANVVFKEGDGVAKAKSYMLSKKLVFKAPKEGSDKPGIWVLPGEAELKAKMKIAVKASGEFVKCRRDVKKIEEQMPPYDKLEAKLKKEIADLTKHINESWPWPADAQKKKRGELQEDIKKKVKPIKDALAAAGKRAEVAYDKCEKLIEESNTLLDETVERYGELADDEMLYEALSVAGGKIGPTPLLNKQYRQLSKLRVSFERAASN